AAEAGHPLTLDGLAKALGTTVKDSAGTRLINLFCKPNRDGEFTAPEEKPEQWQQFIDYCKQDVAVLQEVFYKLPAETAKEAQAWRRTRSSTTPASRRTSRWPNRRSRP